MNQGIDVDQFNGTRSGLHLVLRQTQGAGGRKQQGRTDPLAAAQDAVAHRRMESRRNRILGRQSRSQRRFHAASPTLEQITEHAGHRSDAAQVGDQRCSVTTGRLIADTGIEVSFAKRTSSR